jgi:predicted TIM-barrel fold metal-dependent hydrolase
VTQSKVERIRAEIDHPVLDADGHTIEITPVLMDFVKEVGGASGLSLFVADTQEHHKLKAASLEERYESWSNAPVHWAWPAHTLDRATAALPRLYYDRMDEIGLDLSLVYPSLGLRWQMLPDDNLRPMVCRALNLYMTEMHAGLTDRLLPVAAIPMHNPEEAIDELEYAVNVLGMRAVLIPSFVCRPIPRIHGEHPEYDDIAFRFDTYGLDSEYDYDAVWAKCIELKVVPGVHTPSNGVGFRRSPSNYVHNHIGSFATSCEALCKSLLLGGVFHRFPNLRVAALEGGVGWAASLYADFLAHWEKRNGDVIEQLNPKRLDRGLLTGLISRYGTERIRAKSDQVLERLLHPGLPPIAVDEFAACPFASAEEIRDLFTSRIFVGCEADDPMNALAFNSSVNPLGARFRVMFGSDISHWDVPDVSKVLEEAYELVERELITEDDFRDFTFTNAVQLYGGLNPSVFEGTTIEKEVVGTLSSRSSAIPEHDA